MAPLGNQNALGNEGGRPTSYDPIYCQRILEHFDVPHYVKKTINYKGKEIEIEKANRFPTLEGFAASIGVSIPTVRAWTEKFPEFLSAFEKSKQLQKDMLIRLGIEGAYEKTFAIFVAKNATDMRDKQEIEHSGSVEAVPTGDIDEIVTRVEKELRNRKVENVT